MKKYTTQRDVSKGMLYGDCLWMRDETAVSIFLDEFNYRQKRFAKKRGTNHYTDWLYYVCYDGRLARVMNTCRKPLGLRLLKEKKIYKDSYGILRSDEEIPQGQIVKHRPLLDEFSKGKWNKEIVERIANYLDGGARCTMVIDTNFYDAYAPDYHYDYSLEGDLVSGTSCMSGREEYADDFYGAIKGCKVARFLNEDGENVGRCIVYEYNGIRHFIRIYCQPDYGSCALRLLRKEMKEGDLLGRSKVIEGLCLEANWDYDTASMYLDGNHYGLHVEPNGRMYVVDDNTERVHSGLNLWHKESIKECLGEDGWYVCPECGELHNESCFYVDGDYYCDECCLEKAGFAICHQCGEINRCEDMYWAPDERGYCSVGCLNRNDWHVCQECGEIVGEDDSIYVSDKGWYCSDDCARQDGCEKCVRCNEWMTKEKLYECPDGELRCAYCGEKEGFVLKFVKADDNTEANND